MTHANTATAFVADLTEPMPRQAVEAVQRSPLSQGLVRPDGLIGLFNAGMMLDLGFAPDDDLTGLSFASLWHRGARAPVDRALRSARQGATERIDIDLAYLTGNGRSRTISLSRGDGDVVLVALDDTNA